MPKLSNNHNMSNSFFWFISRIFSPKNGVIHTNFRIYFGQIRIILLSTGDRNAFDNRTDFDDFLRYKWKCVNYRIGNDRIFRNWHTNVQFNSSANLAETDVDNWLDIFRNIWRISRDIYVCKGKLFLTHRCPGKTRNFFRKIEIFVKIQIV